MPKQEFASLQWAEQISNVVTAVSKAVMGPVMDTRALGKPLGSAYAKAFASDTHQKLSRFGSLKQHLLKDLLPKRLVEYQHTISEAATKLLQTVTQNMYSNPGLTLATVGLSELTQGVQGHMVALMVENFKNRPFDLTDFKLEEDEHFQTERASLNAQLAKLLAAQQSLANISRTAAFIPANKFHLGTYKEAASANVPNPSDAEELPIKPSLHSATPANIRCTRCWSRIQYTQQPTLRQQQQQSSR